MLRCRRLLNLLFVFSICSGKLILPPADGCPDVPDPENGIASMSESGSVIRFQCLNGYSLRGADMISCTEEGWSGSVPKCIPEQTSLPRGDTTCLASPPNTPSTVFGILRRSHDNGDEYFVAIYTCYQGFKLISGGTTMTCSESQWIWPPEGAIECVPTCAAPTFYCQHSCIDQPTGAVCACHQGYYLYENKQYCFNINECRTEGICGHGVCQDHTGTYRCHCYEGYELVNGRCEDHDECEYLYACTHGQCVNTIGSYRCDCNAGYRSSSNNVYCDDINECVANSALCEHGTCYNDYGGYICGCDYGFRESADRRSCDDIDECENGENRCAQACTNTVGSYTCGCTNGYILHNDQVSCIDFDECQDGQNVCPDGHVCENTLGSYTCRAPQELCQPGYSFRGGKCKDINECKQDHGYGSGFGYCEAWCANTAGSYRCTCPQSSRRANGKWIGYQLAEDGHRCIQPVCSSSNCEHICIPLSSGTSFRCSCNAGYQLHANGYECVDINECASEEAHDCPHDCINTEGSYECRCLPGHVTTPSGDCEACRPNSYYNLKTNRCFDCPANSGTDGTAKTSIRHCSCNSGYESTSDTKLVCTDIDECADDNFGCSLQCFNTPGSAYCVCELGYELDETGKTCVDMNECELKNGGCQHHCANTIASFNCSCNDGYIQDPDDKYRCQDIDECANDNGGCEITCRNYDGGYYCECTENTLINDDGVTCDAIVCSPLVVPHDGKLTPKKRCTGMENGYSLIVGTTCEYSCHTGYELTERATRICLNTGRWSGDTPSCRPLTCPPLPPIEHGEVIPASCVTNPQVFKSRCAYTCEQGYVIDGNQFSRCKGLEGWTSATPKCVEDIRPEIACNDSITVTLDEGESATTVDIPEPVHNLEYVERDKPADTLFGPGSHHVTFTARSLSHDSTITCDVTVTVLDVEPPKFSQCPENFVVQTEEQYPTVSWQEPTVTDNVIVTKNSTSISPNGRFTWGTFVVTYEARDAANNIAFCVFDIKIEPKSCGLPNGPLNGEPHCTYWLFGEICIPTCNEGFYFFDGALKSVYVCGATAVWTPDRSIPDCTAYTLLEVGQSGCPVGTQLKNYTYIGGAACLECPRGKFGKMIDNEAVCLECPIGTYQTSTAMESCVPCPIDLSTANPGALAEEECIQVDNQQEIETTEIISVVTEIIEEVEEPPEESSILGSSYAS